MKSFYGHSSLPLSQEGQLLVGLNNILFRASIHLQHINKIWHKDLTVSHLSC